MANTELVFKMYEYFNAGKLDAIRSELFAPDIVWRMPGHHPLSGTMSGVDEVMSFLTNLFQAGITVDNAHFGELDDGTVCEKHLGHAELDGEKFLFPTSTTYGVRDGRLADVQVHTAVQHDVDRYFWARFQLKPVAERVAS
ncbi:nuclear transport factor 2 family protein [Actinorugispora endophytica]|uniref:Ketosteroid isomerase-like protein n=1 Tax=Actinorugispora endophytica TaxID=1605990 RepID=A0A4R6UTW2_9ACTN|nr:nuclear transport factor 2 family protein [Actinorugispora endophytica]TDQ46894.1 ketosteroid isomerase-like protein [Actinorugispora endophytica]